VIGLTIDQAKALFLDTRTLDKSMRSMRIRVTVKQTNLVKKIAQRLMRPGGKKGKRSSRGEPPRTHGKRQLRKVFYSTFDPNTESSVAGPALLTGNRNQRNTKLLGVVTVPQLLEGGGKMEVTEVRKPQDLVLWKYLAARAYSRGNFSFDADRDWTILDGRFRRSRYAGAEIRTRKAFMEPRPYMVPAMKDAKPKFAAMYRDQFKKVA
jgi:hypothetical protein